jgi:hypothetical protein
MRILVLKTGEYGQRHVENLEKFTPGGWSIEGWQTPRSLPIVLDYPEDYLPDSLPPADLILSLAELPGVAEMIPDMATMTGATAVIAPIDNQAWLPFGLARQLREWLAQINVDCVTPMPFCSLTKSSYNALRLKESYDNELIRTFSAYFGRPTFDVSVDKSSGTIESIAAIRDACCGCGRFAAEKLEGTFVGDAVEQIGLHHHHYPCQASMGIDPLYGDTLMHISGNIMKDALREALGDDLNTSYLKPNGYIEDDQQ